MDQCLDDGTLRAHLDGALPQAAGEAAQRHLAGCLACAARADELRVRAERAAALLAAPVPDTRAALARARLVLSASEGATRPPTPPSAQRSTPMTIRRSWRRGLTALATLALVAAALALPPVQAAADQLLKIFRVQSVVFVPVEQSRIRELEQLNFDDSTLFVAEPKVVVDPGEPAVVPGAAEAAALAGLPAIAEPALPEPPASVEYRVQGRGVVEFEVNVAAAQQLLTLAGVNDVALPPELGSGPITADVPPVVMATYRGASYDLTLTQGTSPQVAVPDGVDLKVLGTAMLRMLGTSPEQAAQLAAQIDWGTTFVFPFPADMSGVSTVNVDGLTGLLVTSREGGERHSQIYWQRGERFYVLQARGDIDGDALLALVSSIR